MKTRTFVAFSGVVFMLFILIYFSPTGSLAAEKKYPTRSIDIFCGFNPGGPTDLVTRAVARGLEKYLGVTVVPGNKPGAGSMVAANALANSPPDGYTMAMLTLEHFVQPLLYGRATYSLEDFRVVGRAVTFGQVIAVKADLPWKTFQDFLDYVKKNPGVKFGHPGVGTTTYLRMENLNKSAGMKMVGVPFKSDPEMLAACLGGHVPAMVSALTNIKAQADAGKLRVLFSFESSAREGLDPSIADLPTFFGNSVRDFDVSQNLTVPSKTPTEIVDVLKQNLEKVTKDPEYISDVRKLYLIPNFVDGNIIMQKILPERIKLLKEVMTSAGLLK